ncbi:MAG: hypothetical protein JWO86_6148 [Myxococcaceae bacterium]|nr:hypothetical protein [Myxococcaceae bacterium]
MRVSPGSLVAFAAVLGAAAALLTAAPASARDPSCADGEESIGGKCFAKCAAGTARALPGVQCVVQKATGPACKDGEESIGGKCVAKCAPGTVRAVDGLACVSTK